MKHNCVTDDLINLNRAPHGARGLKQDAAKVGEGMKRRAPHGARGLKH